MAGTAKPNIGGIREGAITLHASFIRAHNGVLDVSNNISGLLDGIIKHSSTYGTALFALGNFVEFSTAHRTRIWAISSKAYSDNGGVTSKPIKIQKYDGSTWVDYTTRDTKSDNTWYDLTGELASGTYKIAPTSSYVNFDEWFIEEVYEKRIVIKNNNKHYSLADKTLISLPSASDKNMLLYGIETGKEIQLDVAFDKVNYLVESTVVETMAKPLNIKFE